MHAMDLPSAPSAPEYQALQPDPGPYPQQQVMSPTLTAAFEDHRSETSRLAHSHRGLGSQLPTGYGATAGSSLMNGTAATATLSPSAPAVGSVAVMSGSTAAGATLAPETGPVVTRVQDSVGQGYAYTPTPTAPSAPADSTTSQQQRPYTIPLDRVPQLPEPPASASGASAPVEQSPGTRISLEAQRAMAQLASQRTALVHALQQRATRASSAFAASEGEGEGSAAHLLARDAQPEIPGEEVVWYSRLQGFLRRRVVEPVREQVENLRRSSLNPSPQSAWHSASPAPSESLMDAQTRRAMREWTEQGTSLLTASQRPAQVDGITEEDVHDEVRRQIAAALENRDRQVRSLQSENGELRQLLQAVMEGSDMLERVVDVPQRCEQEGLLRTRILEETGNLGGVRNDGVPRQGDLPCAPPLPVFGSQGDLGNPPGLEARSRGDLGNPPGLEARSRGDLGNPPGLEARSRGVLGNPPGLEARSRGLLRDLADYPGSNQHGGLQSVQVTPPTNLPGGSGSQSAAGDPARVCGAVSSHGEARRQVGPSMETGSVRDRHETEAAPPHVSHTSPVSPMDMLVEGMQQLQQLQLRRDHQEPELLKGSVELPKMPEPYQDGSAVAFLEWVYETGQIIGSITDRASGWWERTLALSLEAYRTFQAAAPLDRLKVEVAPDLEIDDPKWFRMEKRVMTLLLQAMPATIKNEITILRIGKVKACIFKLYTVYAPGGTSERASLIRQLETLPAHDSVLEVTMTLRKWKKLIGRAYEMGVSLPDGSVLLVAVEGAVKKVVDGNRDISFKLSMAKQALHLPHMPTHTAVLNYTDHILAELQQIIPIHKGEAPKLRGVQAEGPTSPSSSAASPNSKKNACRYFMSEEGCRRGAQCKYPHDFPSKEERRARCWTCGAKTHRQTNCPAKSGAGRGKNPKTSSAVLSLETAASSPTTSSGQETTLAALSPSRPEQSALLPLQPATDLNTLSMPMQSSQPPSDTTSSAATSAQAQEIGALAEKFLASLKRLASLRPVQEDTDRAVENLELLLRAQNFDPSQKMALLDSGASHPYRAARSNREHHEARRVAVQLADGRTVHLKQTDGGTLLPEQPNDGKDSSCTILPLGSLVQSLGCTLKWNRRHGLRVYHPTHGLLPTRLVGNCPMLREAEALQLIGDLEQLELEKLQQRTVYGAMNALQNELSSSEPQSWEDHMEQFLDTGKIVDLRRMLRDAEGPIFEDSESARMAVVGASNVDFSDEAGTHVLKALPLGRRTRRRLLRTRWAVHLFSGDGTASEISAVETDTVTVLNVDIRLSKASNLLSDPFYKALLWAAGRGQIEGIYGGPPRQHMQEGLLMTRTLLLWLVAQKGAARERVRAPFLALELPPRHTFWDTELWHRFNSVYDFPLVNVQDNQHSYFFATDLDLGGTPAECPPGNAEATTLPPSSWSAPMRLRLGAAIQAWRVGPHTVRAARALARLGGNLEDMSETELRQWERHVREGHLPFDRRCRTCVRTAGTGRAHRRVITPSAYTLSLDIAGPFRVKGETATGSSYRYALIASYVHPKLEGYHDYDIPDNEAEIDEVDPLDVEEETGVDEGAGVGMSEDEEDPEQRARNERFRALYKEVGDVLEYRSLHYMVPLQRRTASEVFAGVRSVYLKLRREGFPVVRLHSDRGRELMAPALRTWAEMRDMFVTTGESQTPQSNGRAETAVRLLKTRTRTLLRSSGLPRSCWPLAMAYAADRQRSLALGQKQELDIPFGTVVHCKAKMFGEGGKFDLKERWTEGKFVGWSADVAHGKVIRLDSGGFVTTAHMRPFLVDSDELVALDPMEAHVPRPERRRLREKTSLMGAQAVKLEAEDHAKMLLEAGCFEIQDLRELWDLAKRYSTPRARACVHGENPSYLSVGQYTHGAFCGLLSSTYKYPHLTAYLTRAFEEIAGTDIYAALSVFDNVGMTCHRDIHNERSSDNILVALTSCDSGGGIWVEAKPEDFSFEDEWRQISNGEWRRGRVHTLEAGVPFRFNARLWHQTEPWEGRRILLVAYTPRMGAITRPTYDALLDMGFNPPPFQGPDIVTPTLKMMGMASEDKQVDAVAFLVKKEKEGESLKRKAMEATAELQTLQEDVVARLHQRADFLADLLVEEEMLADELADVGRLVREEAMDSREAVMEMIKEIQLDLDKAIQESSKLFLRAATVPQEEIESMDDVEAYLEALEGDLGVTLTVPLEQVREHLHSWVEAMKKELNNVETTTGAVERISYSEARRKEAKGLLRLVPGKMVFTVKPPPEPSTTSSSRMRWKRKARMVICGNHVGLDSDHTKSMLYASGASAESLRIALCLATVAGWTAAATDITGAFLLAKWPESKPTYGVIPPKILVQCGLVEGDQVFLVRRPLYGLREAPSLWASYRTEQLNKIRVPYEAGHLQLKPLISDTELWLILYVQDTEIPVVYGIIVCYVDDLLYLAVLEVIKAVHTAISGVWPCSALEFADQCGGIRYLGMELEVVDGAFALGQRGYVENLIKAHGLAEDASAALPCPKEWLSDSDLVAEEENFSEEELRQGQRLVGECLWLSCRTRPDIVFVTNYMASIVAKRPCLAAKIGTKVLSYLNASADLKLKMDGRSSSSSSSSSSTSHPPLGYLRWL